MMPTAEQERWEVLEKIGAYAAGELDGEEAREAEALIFERPDYRRLSESYARMLVMLNTFADEPVEVPEAVINFALRRAYVSAIIRNAEVLLTSMGRSYLDAFDYYLGLRPGPAREGYGGGI